jgi:hypothetical protein
MASLKDQVAWRRIYAVECAENRLRAAGCRHGFVKAAYDYISDEELIVVEVRTADGRMKFEEPYKVFPSPELLTKIALVSS